MDLIQIPDLALDENEHKDGIVDNHIFDSIMQSKMTKLHLLSSENLIFKRNNWGLVYVAFEELLSQTSAYGFVGENLGMFVFKQDEDGKILEKHITGASSINILKHFILVRYYTVKEYKPTAMTGSRLDTHTKVELYTQNSLTPIALEGDSGMKGALSLDRIGMGSEIVLLKDFSTRYSRVYLVCKNGQTIGLLGLPKYIKFHLYESNYIDIVHGDEAIQLEKLNKKDTESCIYNLTMQYNKEMDAYYIGYIKDAPIDYCDIRETGIYVPYGTVRPFLPIIEIKKTISGEAGTIWTDDKEYKISKVKLNDQVDYFTYSLYNRARLKDKLWDSFLQKFSSLQSLLARNVREIGVHT